MRTYYVIDSTKRIIAAVNSYEAMQAVFRLHDPRQIALRFFSQPSHWRVKP